MKCCLVWSRNIAAIVEKNRAWFYLVQRLLQGKRCETCSCECVLFLHEIFMKLPKRSYVTWLIFRNCCRMSQFGGPYLILGFESDWRLIHEEWRGMLASIHHRHIQYHICLETVVWDLPCQYNDCGESELFSCNYGKACSIRYWKLKFSVE